MGINWNEQQNPYFGDILSYLELFYISINDQRKSTKNKLMLYKKCNIQYQKIKINCSLGSNGCKTVYVFPISELSQLDLKSNLAYHTYSISVMPPSPP